MIITLVVTLGAEAKDIKIEKKDTISLEQLIKVKQIPIEDGDELTIEGALEKEDVHFIAALAKEKKIRTLDLSKSYFGEIGLGLFEGCTCLGKIYLPNTLRTIAKCAFKGCDNLAEIRFSKNLTSIGKEAFENCTRLTNIKLYSKLSWIGTDAFKGCSLQKVTLNRNRHFSYDGKHIYSSNGTIVY